MMLSIQDVLKLENKPTKHVAKFMMNGEQHEFEFYAKELKVTDSIAFSEFFKAVEEKKPAAENLIKAAKFIEAMVVDENGRPLFEGLENIIGADIDDDFNLTPNNDYTALPDRVFSAIGAVLNKTNDFKEDEGKG